VIVFLDEAAESMRLQNVIEERLHCTIQELYQLGGFMVIEE